MLSGHQCDPEVLEEEVLALQAQVDEMKWHKWHESVVASYDLKAEYYECSSDEEHSRIKRCEELEARIGALEAKAGTAPRDVVQGLVDAAHFVITNNLPDEVEGVSALAKSTGAVGAALSDTTTGDKE